MRKEIECWWEQARMDMEAACKNFDIAEYYVSSFLCQQAVEKALKAYLISKTGELIKVHDLPYLCRKAGIPDNIASLCDRLNTIYIDTRYPDMSGDIPSKKFTKQITEENLADAKEVLRWLQNKLLKK